MFRIAMVMRDRWVELPSDAVPFHFYAPDVFQGVTPSVAGMLYICSQSGRVFGALLRLLPVCFGASVTDFVPGESVRMILTGLAI